jgi:hypothetical protein
MGSEEEIVERVRRGAAESGNPPLASGGGDDHNMLGQGKILT